MLGAGSVKAQHKLHERPLDAITVTDTHVFTGGRDGFVNVLNATSYALLFKFEIGPKFASVCNTVRSIALHPNKSQLLIGTLGSEIYEISIDLKGNKVGADPKIVTQGHYSPCKKDNNEVWGL